MKHVEQTFTLTLGKRRRFYVPVGLSRALGAEPGDRLAWVIEGTAVWLVNPVPTPEGTYHTALVTKANAEDDHPQDRQQTAKLFRELQEGEAFREIVDPVAWQREQRQDRRLPGRSADDTT